MKSADTDLEFFSKFEGRNLDSVVEINNNEFGLYIRPDTNARGYNQWFYFGLKIKEIHATSSLI